MREFERVYEIGKFEPVDYIGYISEQDMFRCSHEEIHLGQMFVECHACPGRYGDTPMTWTLCPTVITIR